MLELKSMFIGLSESQAIELRNEFGENSLPQRENASWILIFLSQFKSPLVYTLIVVSAISFFLKDYLNVVLILVVVLVNSLMGFFQEYRAQKTLLALRKILKPKIIVIRDGKRREIEISQLVPGDLAVLYSGDKVPADGKMIEGTNLLISEAILTGEEEAIQKSLEKGKSFLFMGTTVISGRGTMEVSKIGKETEMGRIGQSLSEIKEGKTPLQIRLEKFSKNLAVFILVICLGIFIVGILNKQDPLDMLIVSTILVVAAIPEGLPIAISVILTIGMRRILKRNGLVKKLLSVETLGATSVICTDKTGTLTRGIMQVVKVDFTDWKLALTALTLASNQKTNMEIAIWEYIKNAKEFDPEILFNSSKRIYEESFDSEKKYAMVINDFENKEVGFIVGAPEIILSFCNIEDADRKETLEKIEKWAEEGLRILGVASKQRGNLKEKKNYTWLGIVGIEDPIREEVKEAIETARESGIDVKIVTGDYKKTAEKVAFNLGFKFGPENVIEGNELELISEDELKGKIKRLIIFARVTPHQKLKIVKALQENGEIVAMVGDGVNDSPALKKADIGVVVGEASEVAKESADLILLDSNFKTIVAACEEGRVIFSNIKKVVGYVLSNSFVEIVLIFGAILLKFPPPLLILQILWIHIICDGPPDIVLGFEPKESSVMNMRPKDIHKEDILSKSMKFLVVTVSLITGLMALTYFWYFYFIQGDLILARTIAFVSVAIIDLIYIFSFKNLKKSVIHSENFFGNKYLFGGVAYGIVLVIAAIYVPFLNRILETVPLNIYQWLLALSVGIAATFWVEIVKYISNKIYLNGRV